MLFSPLTDIAANSEFRSGLFTLLDADNPSLPAVLSLHGDILQTCC